MLLLRRAALAAAWAGTALGVPPVAATAPQVPCTIVPTVTTTRPVVSTWHTLSGGPWLADRGVEAVTIDCRVYVHVPDGPIATARATTPGRVGVAASVPFPAPSGADLVVCTTVTYEYAGAPGPWVAHDACVTVPGS